MRLHSGLLVIAVLAALVPKSAEASPLIFTDRATFLNVHTALGLPPLAYETFDTNGWSFVIPGSNDPCIRDLNGLTIHADCHQVGAFNAGPAIFDQSIYSTSAVFDEPQTSVGFDYNVGGPAFCSPFSSFCTATMSLHLVFPTRHFS
jgi:hypothetical protein